MFKKLFTSSLLSVALLMSCATVHTGDIGNEERTIIKTAIDNIIANIPKLVEEFSHLPAQAQVLVIDLCSKMLQPNKFTEAQAQKFQTHILEHLENDRNAKEFFQKVMQEIASACQPYLHYLEDVFTNQSQQLTSEQEKFNLFMSLNQRAAELYQIGVSFYYDALYTYVKEMTPNNLMALIADDGDLIPANKRSKKIPSIEEIQDSIREAQKAATSATNV